MSGPFEVDYHSANDVPTVHRTGCVHRSHRGRPRQPLKAQTLDAAIIEAQYQGHAPAPEWDIGDTVAAPCARKS